MCFLKKSLEKKEFSKKKNVDFSQKQRDLTMYFEILRKFWKNLKSGKNIKEKILQNC